MNIVVPMAGLGSRFADAGYTFPKPLVEIGGRPMIEVVVDALNIQGRYVFLCRREHLDQYALTDLFDRLTDDHVVVPVEHLTEGAACTVLLARDFIDNDEPLVIANSDQWVRWDPAGFFETLDEERADGGILTFHSTHPKWSYARTDPATGLVTEVAEKRPISEEATVGVYYFRRGSDFVRSADAMIAKDARVNGEFYVAPVYNEFIAAGARVITYPVQEMWGIGTPEDLESYKRHRLIP
jgi:NDP-sugar pyrophosphorylase family protein